MQNASSSPDPNAVSAGSNLRRTERLPLELPVRLVFADLSRAIDVTLRDVSWDGLRLTSPAEIMLPRDVYLLVPDAARGGLLRLSCETRWRVGNAAGLRFAADADKAAIAALIAHAKPENTLLQSLFQDLSGS